MRTRALPTLQRPDGLAPLPLNQVAGSSERGSIRMTASEIAATYPRLVADVGGGGAFLFATLLGEFRENAGAS